MKKTGRPPVLANKISEQIRLAAEQGITSAQILENIKHDITAQSIRSVISRLASIGEVFIDENFPRKYFAKKEWAEQSETIEKAKHRNWKDKYSAELMEECRVMVIKSSGVQIVDIVDATGRHRHTIQAVLSHLKQKKSVFVGRVRNEHRFFGTKEEADAYSDTRVKLRAPKKKQVKKKPVKELKPERTTGTESIERDRRISWANAEPIIPEGVKRTCQKAPPGRFEVTEPIQNGYFSSLGILNYKNTDTAISRAYG